MIGSKTLSDMAKLTKGVSGQAGIQSQVYLTLMSVLVTNQCAPTIRHFEQSHVLKEIQKIEQQ